MKNLNIREDEQQMIRKALESLATSYTSDTLDGLIEKYNAIVEKEGGQKVFWDFGVSRENKKVQDSNRLLEKAIHNKNVVSFSYQKADGTQSQQSVEPLAIHYKWYAWYLFAYSEKKAGIPDLQNSQNAGYYNRRTESGKRSWRYPGTDERIGKGILPDLYCHRDTFS